MWKGINCIFVSSMHLLPKVIIGNVKGRQQQFLILSKKHLKKIHQNNRLPWPFAYREECSPWLPNPHAASRGQARPVGDPGVAGTSQEMFPTPPCKPGPLLQAPSALLLQHHQQGVAGLH